MIYSLDEPERLSVGLDLAERHSGLVALSGTSDPYLFAEIVYDLGPRDDQEGRDGGVERLLGDVCGIVGDRQPGTAYRLLIEDVPPQGMISPKYVLRQQGALTWELRKRGIEYELILPQMWQRPMGYKRQKGRTTKGWAKERCAELGFVSKMGGKGAVDTRDAYLMARFGLLDWPVEA